MSLWVDRSNNKNNDLREQVLRAQKESKRKKDFRENIGPKFNALNQDPSIPLMPDGWAFSYSEWRKFCKNYDIKTGYKETNTHGINGAKIIEALKDIGDQLYTINKEDAESIFDLIKILQTDFSTYSKYPYRNTRREEAVLLYNVEDMLDKYEDYFNINQIIVVVFGMYLVRVKYKKAREDGIPGFNKLIPKEV